MSDAVYKKLFQIINQDTAMMLTKYDSKKDSECLNNLYSDYIESIADSLETTGFINYLTLLIAFLEQKEDYLWCKRLFDLKNRLIQYDKDGKERDNK